MMNYANLVTVLRLILAPICVVLMVFGCSTQATIVFVIAAMTDGLDGYIAREFKQATELGKKLDPIADKVLVLSASITLLLLSYSLELGVIMLLLFVRELLVTYLRVRYPSLPGLAVSMIAKWKTVLQMTGLSVLIVSLDYPFYTSFGLLVMNISLVLSWWSFRNYVKNIREHLTISATS